ncbi:hypothetical protein LZ575_06320 [Antarcticibacterium sp. 1MA-6-2]|uniref:hypothetical protein n=1 Tax=Antarcticibacterium sp. 1MA-6-2 TaxID=2908210 RepID=UPI001F300763|nr:hypothetical protein [Antarcticibacterium sp. 1MA-6-2]UJH92187.1 hypothetical protein LZ575_06320 [Antarcticibacterium sp. 1MA-6-2]
MKSVILCIVFCFSSFLVSSQQKSSEILPSEVQITTAVLPAPEQLREGAMVYGYDKQGKMIILREGTNNLVCIADDPTRKGISVSCYSKKLDPFMSRGRALAAEGKSETEKREIRRKEAESGELILPDAPSMTYIFSGTEENYDRSTGELKDGSLRYVIYIPYATVESTGLPDKPHAPGMPWLMDPGTHRAHIMITPPQN